MMPVLRSTCAVVVSLWFLAYPPGARADPIAISSGVILAEPHISLFVMGVQGPGFSFVSTPIGEFVLGKPHRTQFPTAPTAIVGTRWRTKDRRATDSVNPSTDSDQAQDAVPRGWRDRRARGHAITA